MENAFLCLLLSAYCLLFFPALTSCLVPLPSGFTFCLFTFALIMMHAFNLNSRASKEADESTSDRY
jgi:hypothetical protein